MMVVLQFSQNFTIVNSKVVFFSNCLFSYKFWFWQELLHIILPQVNLCCMPLILMWVMSFFFLDSVKPLFSIRPNKPVKSVSWLLYEVSNLFNRLI